MSESGGLSFAARCGRALPEKVAVWLGLAVGICVPYFTLQRVAWFPAGGVARTPLDGLPFQPEWVFVYHSIALLVPLAPLLATERQELRRYAVGLALLCGACFLLFLVYPVAGPRPPQGADLAAYRFLISVDRPENSLPSLHAGLTLYTFLFAWRVFGSTLDPRGRVLFIAGSSLWGSAILLSTLLTKQHWAWDLPPALVLAGVAHRWAWRRP